MFKRPPLFFKGRTIGGVSKRLHYFHSRRSIYDSTNRRFVERLDDVVDSSRDELDEACPPIFMAGDEFGVCRKVFQEPAESEHIGL